MSQEWKGNLQRDLLEFERQNSIRSNYSRQDSFGFRTNTLTNNNSNNNISANNTSSSSSSQPQQRRGLSLDSSSISSSSRESSYSVFNDNKPRALSDTHTQLTAQHHSQLMMMNPLLFEEVDLKLTPLSSLRSCSEFQRLQKNNSNSSWLLSQQQQQQQQQQAQNAANSNSSSTFSALYSYFFKSRPKAASMDAGVPAATQQSVASGPQAVTAAGPVTTAESSQPIQGAAAASAGGSRTASPPHHLASPPPAPLPEVLLPLPPPPLLPTLPPSASSVLVSLSQPAKGLIKEKVKVADEEERSFFVASMTKRDGVKGGGDEFDDYDLDDDDDDDVVGSVPKEEDTTGLLRIGGGVYANPTVAAATTVTVQAVGGGSGSASNDNANNRSNTTSKSASPVNPTSSPTNSSSNENSGNSYSSNNNNISNNNNSTITNSFNSAQLNKARAASFSISLKALETSAAAASSGAGAGAGTTAASSSSPTNVVVIPALPDVADPHIYTSVASALSSGRRNSKTLSMASSPPQQQQQQPKVEDDDFDAYYNPFANVHTNTHTYTPLKTGTSKVQSILSLYSAPSSSSSKQPQQQQQQVQQRQSKHSSFSSVTSTATTTAPLLALQHQQQQPSSRSSFSMSMHMSSNCLPQSQPTDRHTTLLQSAHRKSIEDSSREENSHLLRRFSAEHHRTNSFFYSTATALDILFGFGPSTSSSSSSAYAYSSSSSRNRKLQQPQHKESHVYDDETHTFVHTYTHSLPMEIELKTIKTFGNQTWFISGDGEINTSRSPAHRRHHRHDAGDVGDDQDDDDVDNVDNNLVNEVDVEDDFYDTDRNSFLNGPIQYVPFADEMTTGSNRGTMPRSHLGGIAGLTIDVNINNNSSTTAATAAASHSAHNTPHNYSPDLGAVRIGRGIGGSSPFFDVNNVGNNNIENSNNSPQNPRYSPLASLPKPQTPLQQLQQQQQPTHEHTRLYYYCVILPSNCGRSALHSGTYTFPQLCRRWVCDPVQDELFYEHLRVQPFGFGAYLRGMLWAGFSSLFFMTYSLVLWPTHMQTLALSSASSAAQGPAPNMMTYKVAAHMVYCYLCTQVVLNMIQLPLRMWVHFKCWQSSRTVDVDTALRILRTLLHSPAWAVNRFLGRIQDLLAVAFVCVSEVYLQLYTHTPEYALTQTTVTLQPYDTDINESVYHQQLALHQAQHPAEHQNFIDAPTPAIHNSSGAGDPLYLVIVSICASCLLALIVRVCVCVVFAYSLHDPMVLGEARKRGLSKFDVDNLPTFVFARSSLGTPGQRHQASQVCEHEGDGNEPEVHNHDCSICLGEFELGEMLISLPCTHKHSFHANCIRTWLQRQNSCPLCQRMV